MKLKADLLHFVLGNEEIIDNMENVPGIRPFHETVIRYLDAVSKLLLDNKEAKKYPDVVTFAFWCRRASLLNLSKPYQDTTNRIGRGIAFHIAPSNVAVNFAYSLTVGLLSGNANIVRLPSKKYEQITLICDALSMALEETIKPYISLIQYEPNQEITDYLSGACDTRIIWGGNETIATIRKSPMKPRGIEVTFADRYSICLIDCEAYLQEEDKKSVAQGFYNDTYLTDQNACTSPRIVIWLGKNKSKAQDNFWNELHELVMEKYELQPVKAVGKYSNLCRQAALNPFIHCQSHKDNYILRIKTEELKTDMMESKGNCGYFLEYEADSLTEIGPLCQTGCQTLSYFGIDSKRIQDYIIQSGFRGVDRIVPIGKTMNFSLVWDGFDLIRSLSRIIDRP